MLSLTHRRFLSRSAPIHSTPYEQKSEYVYVDSTCPYPNATTSVTLEELEPYYGPYACATDEEVGCRQNGKLVLKSDWDQIVSYKNSALDVMAVLPLAEDLLTCAFVNTTLHDLTENACGDVIADLDSLWIGFALIGVGLFVAWFLAVVTQGRTKATSKEQEVYG